MDHLKAFRKVEIKWRNATVLQKEKIAFFHLLLQVVYLHSRASYTLTLQEHILYLWEKMLSIPLVLLCVLVLVHFTEL